MRYDIPMGGGGGLGVFDVRDLPHAERVARYYNPLTPGGAVKQIEPAKGKRATFKTPADDELALALD